MFERIAWGRYRCDACGLLSETGPEWPMPEGWSATLVEDRSAYAKIPKHVCPDPKCAVELAKTRAA